MISTVRRVRVNEGIDGRDAVGLYLDGIAKTPLLTAEEEVALAKRIEAGMFARLLDGTVSSDELKSGVDATVEARTIAADGGPR